MKTNDETMSENISNHFISNLQNFLEAIVSFVAYSVFIYKKLWIHRWSQ